MTDSTDTMAGWREPLRRGRRIAVILSVLLLTITCVVVTPNQWHPDHGPVLPHDTFPTDCSLCHLPGGWNQIRSDFTYDHAKETGVPLEGAHKTAGCLRCHNDRGPVQQFNKRGCVGCHADTHRGKLGRECRDCHDESSWRPKEQIARHRRTRFPLVGAHAAAACYRCHAGAQVGNFEGASIDCASCHQADLRRATAPNHLAQGWTASCEKCHAPLDWRRARFAHPVTFPLTGSHASASCAQCHTNAGQFAGLSTSCSACHLEEYKRTRKPPHALAGIGTDCAVCHGNTSWAGGRYQHPASFPLTGRHRTDCATCHGVGTFKRVASDCNSCHAEEYARAQRPEHLNAGYARSCEQCHSTNGWQPAKAASHPATFPLRNAHATARCDSCHTGPTYRGLQTVCASCHLPEYTNSQDPRHAAAQFATDCTQCHGDVAWRPAKYSHPPSFALTGAHVGRKCAACHTGAIYQGLPSGCNDCHAGAYNTSTNPRHGPAQLPKDCAQCHGDVTWRPANYSHPTSFPLTGAHLGQQCNACHTGTVYKGLPGKCVDCHLGDYQKTTNPNHTTAQFPTSCESCHATTRWTPATFNHKFPRTGDHNVSCKDCHTTPNNYTLFSCTHCHDHRKSEMDDEHKGVSGYQWLSTSCYTCHPQGRER